MSSKSSVKKNKLAFRIEEEGFLSIFPCTRCARLHKSCVKSEGSDRCSECVRSSRTKCVDSEMTFSDKEWRKLVAAQNKLKDEEEEAMMKILRLRKQQKLLQKRAGDFIARDLKEIEELEKLEEEEAKEKARLAKEKEAEAEKARQAERDQQELIASLLNAPTVGGQDAVGSDVFSYLNQSYLDIPESYHGSSSS